MNTAGTRNTLKTQKARKISDVPFLFEQDDFSSLFPKEKIPVLFLDFDGTLSPIVRHPEDAALYDGMKKVLKRCTSRFTMAVVSGRDMDDVRQRVGIGQIIYAGSHGFHISGPGGMYMEHELTDKIVPLLDQVEEQLLKIFPDAPKGIKVERKKYAIAVHYRNVEEENLEDIRNNIDNVVKQFSNVKTSEGKKIIEVKPDIDWDKGKAVRWILDKFDILGNKDVTPVYIGDDTTDEDAFKTLPLNGIGILVGSHEKPTFAGYRLKDVGEVKTFLQKLYKIREDAPATIRIHR